MAKYTLKNPSDLAFLRDHVGKLHQKLDEAVKKEDVGRDSRTYLAILIDDVVSTIQVFDLTEEFKDFPDRPKTR